MAYGKWKYIGFLTALSASFAMMGCQQKISNTKDVFEQEETEGAEPLEWMETIETFETEIENNAMFGSATFEKVLQSITTMDAGKYTTRSWSEFLVILDDILRQYQDVTTEEEAYALERKILKEKSKLEFVASSEEVSPLCFRALEVSQYEAEMGAGFQIDITHLLTEKEKHLTYQQFSAFRQLVTNVHDMGFHTIWLTGNYTGLTDDENGREELALQPLQNLVDICMEQDMYVVLQLGEQDDSFIRMERENLPKTYEMYEQMWRELASRFRDYDEHLVFAGFCPKSEKSGQEAVYEAEAVNNCNQIFVNVVRSTGSHNTKRILAVTGRGANLALLGENSGFQIPNDPVSGKLFLYGDYQSVSTQENDRISVEKELDLLNSQCIMLRKNYLEKGYPILLRGTITSAQDEERNVEQYALGAARSLKKNGIIPIYEGQNLTGVKVTSKSQELENVTQDKMNNIERKALSAFIKGCLIEHEMEIVGKDNLKSEETQEETKVDESLQDETQSEETYCLTGTIDENDDTVICELVLPQKELTLEFQEVREISYSVIPSNANDVLLWKTSDPYVATVYNGQIYARGIGETSIIVYSQSGSVREIINVQVQPSVKEKRIQPLTTKQQNYVLKDLEQITILPAEEKEGLPVVTYRSKSPERLLVNRLGQCTPFLSGEADILMTAADGRTCFVPILIQEQEEREGVKLSCNVLFRDTEKKYFGNEVGEVITVSGDGKYTVTFDVTRDLSKEAVDAGITSLENMTAIYIKDYAVTSGEETESLVGKCSISYDNIVVDGKELSITNSSKLDAVKPSGIFDTNGPINAWGECLVNEIDIKDHVFSFVGLEKPKRITITFTLEGFTLKN